MRTGNHNSAEVTQITRRAPARGVALIFTLLILSLLMVLSLGMVIALSSQTFIGGYYRSFRGAFYAADSGANTVRQYMANAIQNAVPGTITVGSTPLAASGAATIATNANTAYSSWTSINSGQGATSWPGQFEVNSSNPPTLSQTACTLNSTTVGTVAGGPFTCTNLPPTICGSGVVTNCVTMNNFTYTYSYAVDVYGNVKGTQQQSEIIDNGNFNITVSISPPNGVTTTSSFAAYGMFIDQSTPCTVGSSMSSYLVYGEVTGKMFTNGSWNFANKQGGSYLFPGDVDQHGATAMYGTGSSAPGTCTAETTKAGVQSATIGGNLNVGMASVPLPSNSYSQLWAVIDRMGSGEINPQPGNGDYTGSLKDATQTAIVPGTNGVYLPYSTASGTPTFTGGGIFIQGDASVTLTAGTATSNSNPEIYTIVQSGSQTTGSPTTTTIGENKSTGASCTIGTLNCKSATKVVTVQTTPTTTYTVTINDLAGTTQFVSSTSDALVTTTQITCAQCNSGVGNSNTTVNSNSTLPTNTVNITGVPEQVNPVTNAVMGPATMLYDNGNITSLSGPSSGGAVQNGTALTVVAAQNITITGNILYSTPVAYGSLGTTITGTGLSSNAGNSIPGSNNGQVMGIFTSGGNVLLSVANNANLEIDASIATIQSNSSYGIEIANTSNTINALTIVGGRIQSAIQDIGALNRYVYFDQRFNSGFAPPWFPAYTQTSVPSGVENATAVVPTISRVQWVCKSCQ
jgi:hypothetical protein